MSRYLFWLVAVLMLVSCGKMQDKSATTAVQDTTVAMDTIQTQVSQPVYPTQAEQRQQQAENIYKSFFAPASRFYVVAPAGSPLYKAANESSEVSVTLSYGDSVEVVERPFSLTEIENLANAYDTTFFVRVKTGEHEGFLKSCDLMQDKIPKRNDLAHIFLPGGSCVINYSFNKAFTYYGIFKRDGGYVRKKINPVFFIIHSPWVELAWEQYDVRAAGETESADFIYGLPKVLPNGTITQLPFLDDYDDSATITLKNGITMDALYRESGQVTFYSKEKEIQVLRFAHILWYGDLDGDTKPDFVYKSNTDSGNIVIALSSMATGNEVVKEVGFFAFRYCC